MQDQDYINHVAAMRELRLTLLDTNTKLGTQQLDGLDTSAWRDLALSRKAKIKELEKALRKAEHAPKSPHDAWSALKALQEQMGDQHIDKVCVLIGKQGEAVFDMPLNKATRILAAAVSS